ncbi:MAG: thiolase family protein [Desulfobacter sp.]|nr:thiolase family protein [Desulfobacter sp.]
MDKVYIIGLGMIRFNKYPDKDVRTMVQEATHLALEDAGILRSDIQSAFFSNTFWGMFAGQQSIRGQVILRSMGIEAIPVTNVENACAGASTELHMAYASVKAGLQEVVLALGSEKITHENKAVSLGAYASCMDVGNFESHMKMIEAVGKSFTLDIPPDQTPPGKDRSVFMDAYAMGARWHMSKYGSTQEQLAAICAKNHWHGSLNPLSQYQQDMSPDQVLADKAVAYPLTRAMCAPVGDGAAAAIVCSESYLKRLVSPRPLLIRASVLSTGTDRDLNGQNIGERLSKQAYEMAGIGPQDIDLAELHDATAYGELHQTEAMGFCPEGEGGIHALTGATTLGGKQPVNTSGGLECRGHPIGASGLAQIYEIGTQLRQDAGKRQVAGARIGLTENGGGNIGVEEAAMCIHILEKG